MLVEQWHYALRHHPATLFAGLPDTSSADLAAFNSTAALLECFPLTPVPYHFGTLSVESVLGSLRFFIFLPTLPPSQDLASLLLRRRRRILTAHS